MPGYQPISVAAANLLTDEATLLEFQRKGWIQVTKRNDVIFLTSIERYRAKYILHLRQAKQLDDDQVQFVLENQKPPYSAAQVDEILLQYAPASASKDAGR